MADDAQDAAPSADTNGLAIDLAMEEARADPGLRGDVAAFLADQRRLIADQRHHLHLGAWEKRIGVALRIATLAVGLAVAGALGWMVWDAAHTQGLLIEPFTVPAELAARGLSGPAFSSMLLDRLTLLQEQTSSNRPAQSYSNNWGNDLKVEIPETGVSLGEIRRFLREWLGHDTHITGEVWQDAKGLSIAARTSGAKGDIVTGAEGDLDTLMQKVALNIYRVTQPSRYANYLDRDIYHPGFTDIPAAEAIYRRLITDPNPVERGYAWNGLANLAWTVKGDTPSAIAAYAKAYEANPRYGGAVYGIAYLEIMHLSHAEAGLVAGRQYVRNAGRADRNVWLDYSLGDYADALAVRRLQTAGGARDNFFPLYLLSLLHDGPGLREWLRDLPPQPSTQSRFSPAIPLFWTRLSADTALEDWRRVLATEPEVEKLFLANNPGWDVKGLIARNLRPRLALARAKTGDIAGAQSAIAATPGDCHYCVRVRGMIASEAKQWARADWWFAKAVAEAPSIPMAYEDWGRSLLARGKPDDAIAQFTLANRKGPHFADAIEGWGEALMAQNRSHKALAKFAEAEKYAPNWGRLHLKWGQALAYAGKPAEAKAHFTRAAALDLTPSEKSELAKQK